MKKITKVLVANRGEIAHRIAKTLRRLKIRSVAVAIPSEKNSASFSLFDEISVLQRDDLSAYLDAQQLVQIAQEHQAQAIHPGYGFLSENADFARLCLDHHITFIGPRPETILLMGNKNAAKEFATKCGVPTLPNVTETQEQDITFLDRCKELKLPLILKPLNGGGGKGMSVVSSWDQLESQAQQARSIAKVAFNDSRIMAEPLIQKARHLEVQIVGDQQGHVIDLFERDCTLQRRHQKIIEESHSSSIPPNLVEKMRHDALELAKATNYQSLGTVEFIVDGSNYYFMETNTRLQVEHPVTEMTLDVDLVAAQIKIAEGVPLSNIFPKSIQREGHAIEVRIYSENPFQDFIPSTGKILYLSLPKERPGLRVDCGIEQGNHVHHSFDPMLAKITCRASSRKQAIQKLLNVLSEVTIFGVDTNLNYLQWVLGHQDFMEGQHDTTWAIQNMDDFKSNTAYEHQIPQIIESYELEQRRQNSSWYDDPWFGKLNPCVGWKKEKFEVTLDHQLLEGKVIEASGAFWLQVNGWTYVVNKENPDFEDDEFSQSNSIRAPMTGKVIKICFNEGTLVKKNDTVLELESMKMHYKIQTPKDAIVSKIHCQPNDIVDHGSVLVELSDP